MPEVTIKIKGFTYQREVPDPADSDKVVLKSAMAFRGQTVEINDRDYDRGVQYDAFLTDEEDEVPEQEEWTGDIEASELSDDALSDWFLEYEPTIEEVLAAVDDDYAQAQRAKDAEESVYGDDARSSLIAKLEKIEEDE